MGNHEAWFLLKGFHVEISPVPTVMGGVEKLLFNTNFKFVFRHLLKKTNYNQPTHRKVISEVRKLFSNLLNFLKGSFF